MSAKYKFNNKYAYSHPNKGTVKIISLESEDNKVYTIKGLSAEVFIKLVNGEDIEQISKFIGEQENPPPADAITGFITKFIDDLAKLNFIEAR